MPSTRLFQEAGVVKDALKNPASLFALYTALLGGNYIAYHAILPIRISYHIILTGLLIWWIWRDGLPATPLLWPLLGVAVTTGISAFTSIDPRIALESWWHWLVNGLLMLMSISWVRGGQGETLIKSHFAIGGVVVAVSLLQWFVFDPGVRVGGPFALINLTGAYAAALLVPCCIWAWVNKKWWLALVAAGLVAVLILNDSRGAFISAGVAVVVFLLLRYRVKLPVMLIGGAISLLLAFGVMSKSVTGGHADGDAVRQDLWRSALAMVQDNPLTGVGPGLFGQAYRTYGTTNHDTMTGAHSVYLNILAELGVTGGLASALTGLVFLRSLPKRRNAKSDAILAALAGIAAHLLFDNYPASNFVFLVGLYGAYLLGQQQSTPIKKSLKLAAARAITGVLLVYAVSFIMMDTAQFYYEESLSNHSIAEARVAADLDPSNRLYHIHLARLLGHREEVLALDPTFYEAKNLWAYAVISFGRKLW
jgi:O-antigen ligase